MLSKPKKTQGVNGAPNVAPPQNGYHSPEGAQIIARSIETGNAHKDLAGLLVKHSHVAPLVFDEETAEISADHFPPKSPEGFIFGIVRMRAAAGLPTHGEHIEAQLIEAGKRDKLAAQAAANFAEIAENLPLQITPENAVEVARGLARHLLEKQQKPKRFPASSLKEIRQRPRLKYLIQDIYLERGTGVMPADYGSFKSFISLDMGLCVATGKDWQGREVRRGNVVYIMPEGAYTVTDRLTAWMIRWGYEEEPENFHIIEIPVPLSDAIACSTLIEDIREYDPSFIIIDTVAKCNLGREENSNTEMGLFTEGMECLSREFGAFVLGLHHNNKSGTARGGNALQANVDTSITLKRSAGNVVTFECDRTKGKPFDPFSLIGREVELGYEDEYGRPVTSLIFDPTDAPPIEPNEPKADLSRRQLLDILRTVPSMAMDSAEWQKRALTDLNMSKPSFFRKVKELRESKEIVQIGGLYKVREPIEE